MFYISIYRYKFCCKMHMQMFCTEVAVLPAGWGRGRRQAFLARGKSSSDLTFVEKMNLGSRMEASSNYLPAAAAGNFEWLFSFCHPYMQLLVPCWWIFCVFLFVCFFLFKLLWKSLEPLFSLLPLSYLYSGSISRMLFLSYSRCRIQSVDM